MPYCKNRSLSPSPWLQAMSGFSDALMANCQTNPSPSETLRSASCLHIPFLANTWHRHGFRSGINNISLNLLHLCACSPENFSNCILAFKYHTAPLAFHCLNVSRLEDDIVWRRMDRGGAAQESNGLLCLSDFSGCAARVWAGRLLQHGHRKAHSGLE